METDTVLKKEDITETISQTDDMEEEANTEAVNKIKMGSNKICIRNDLAKKSMIFSPESCQAIMDMDNVELIELTKPEFNAHHVYTTHLREQLYVHVEDTFDPTKR